MRTHTVLMGLIFFELAAFPFRAAAQEVRVHALKNWTNHELLGHPVGVGLAVSHPVWGPLGVRLAVERSSGDFQSFGTTCAGLADPGMDCDDEVRADRTRLSALAISVPVTVRVGRRMSVAVLPGARTASFWSSQEGARTGRRRTARERMVGLELGVDARWKLDSDGPFHLVVTGTTAWLSPWKEEIVADGYTPFDRTSRIVTLAVGIAIAR